VAGSARESSAITYKLRIAARPETVFSYFTDPARLVRWMGTEASLDPRPGGVCRIVFNSTIAHAREVWTMLGVPQSGTGPRNGHAVMSGEFVTVEPHRRIVLTWGWEQTLLVLPPQSSEVEVSFTPDGDDTILGLVHRRLPARTIPFHQFGWGHYLPRLADVASGADPGPDPWQATPAGVSQN
jgi:uncharacterized protein YndB with AHSA1/START domain